MIILVGDTARTAGMVRGLRHSGVPVAVVTSRDPVGQRDLALALTDRVTVTDDTAVTGLERRVVIVVGMGMAQYSMIAVSRCTAQLILID